MADIKRGIVKWFNDAKGFGFVEHESGRDVFVHYSVINGEGYKTLKDGEEVEYTLGEGDKGLNASAVMRVNAPKSVETEAAVTEELDTDKTAPILESGNVPMHSQALAESVEVETSSTASTSPHPLMTEQLADLVKH